VACTIYFDTAENGLRPQSLYNEAVSQTHGLNAIYWALDTTRTPAQVFDPSLLVPLNETGRNIQLVTDMYRPASTPGSYFMTKWTGALYAPWDGLYTFRQFSNDGSWLYIDGRQVINFGGLHGMDSRSVQLSLTAGMHDIELVMYAWDGGGSDLRLEWTTPHTPQAIITGGYLYPMQATDAFNALGTPSRIPENTVTVVHRWNTGTTASGMYAGVGTVLQTGSVVSTARSAFAIGSSTTTVTASVQTDRTTYDPGSSAQVAATLTYTSGNETLSGLVATLVVLDPSGAPVTSGVTPVPLLTPGQTTTATLNWSIGNATPGTYTARVTLTDRDGRTLAQGSVPVTVRSSAQTGKGLSGAIGVPATITAGNPIPATISITNGGNDAITNGSFAVQLLDASQAQVASTPVAATIAPGATFTASVTISGVAQGRYTAYLTALLGAPQALASQPVEVTSNTEASFSGSVTGPASIYVGEAATFSVTLTNTGVTAVTNAPFALQLLDSTNRVATSLAFTATISAGGTFTTTLAPPTAAMVAGTYTTTVITTSSNRTIATTPFAINERPDRAITGTLTNPSSVYEAGTLNFQATLTNGGTAPITGGAFAVRISDATGTVDSLGFTADLAPGASFTKTVPYVTGTRTTGNYTATLVSVMTTQPKTLATSQFSIVVQPDKNIAGTISGPGTVYVGDAATFSVTLTNTGATAVTDAPFALQLLDSTNRIATSLPFTATIPAGGTSTTALAPATTAMVTGTYTATVVATSTGRTITTTTFAINERPDRAITGTLTNPSSVYEAGTLSFQATLTNSGTTPITGGSFAIRISDTTGVVDSLAFAADVAPGASFTTAVPYFTSTRTAGSYTATLVSVMTTQAKTLATSQFSIIVQPDKKVSGTIGAPASTLRNDPVTFSVNLANAAPTATGDLPFSIELIDSNNVGAGTLAFHSIIPGSATIALNPVFAGPLTTGTYTASLVSTTSGSHLASTTFTIAPRPDDSLTSTVTMPASIKQGTPLPITVTIANAGAVALTDGTFVARITSGTTVIDNISFNATIGAGGTFTTTLSYATTSLAPGPYTVLVISQVTPTEKELGRGSVTVTLPVDAGFTGTITTSTQVVQGDTISFTYTVRNSGSATVTDSPLVVRITDPSGATVATLSATATIPAGGAVTGQLSMSTAALAVQQYSAALVSLTSNRTLGSTTFAVNYPADHALTGALQSPASVITGSPIPFTVKLVNGGTDPITNGTFAITLTAADGHTVASAPFQANIAAASSTTTTINIPTAGLPAGAYRATLTATITTTKVLAASDVTIIEAPESKLTGQLFSPASANLGETMDITVKITNSGTTAITNGAFAVRLTGPNTTAQQTGFTLSIAPSSAATTIVHVPAAGAAAGTYQLTLVCLIAAPRVLDTNSIELHTTPVTLSISTTIVAPRVLLFASCQSGNSSQPCTPVPPANLTTTLNDAGIPYVLVGDEYTFLAALRTGGFSEAILYQPGAAELHIDKELLASIHAGVGIVLITNQLGAMPKLSAALGATFRGSVKGPQTVQLLQSPFTASSQLTMNGDTLTIDLAGASNAGVLLATQAPAITYRTYGSGRSIIIPFDTELTVSVAVSKLLVASARYVARPLTSNARSVFPVSFTVTAPAGATQNVALSVTLPAGFTIIGSLPAITQNSWNVPAPGGIPVTLTLWLRAPDATGTYTLRGALSYPGQLPFTTQEATITVASDGVKLAQQLGAQLDALRTGASAKDARAIDDARSQLQAVAASTNAPANITRILAVISDLDSITSVTTTAGRAATDDLLLYWQSRSAQ